MQYSTDTPYDEKPQVKSAVIVTPSIQSRYLKDAILSVQKNNTSNNLDINHLIVWDGISPDIDITAIETNPRYKIFEMSLPWNVGRHGFYGHRVYAAISHLINADAIFFLDEDNTFEPNHIQSAIDTLNENNYDYTFSYRNVVEQDGSFICKDRFEAIGTDPINLIDTSSFCFRTPFLVQTGHVWHHGWGADRRFFQIVKSYPFKYGPTGQFTLNYRLDGNPNSPKRDFFLNGNSRSGFTPEGEIK